jgi:outer membrane protease
MQLANTKNKRLALLAAFFMFTVSNSYSMAATSNEVFMVESESKIPVSISISTGVLNGESEELVYEGSYGRVSKLTWDFDRVPVIGINTSVKPSEKFSVNFSGWTKVSESSGNMEDYDWNEGDSEPWTDYSSHDTELDEAYMLDLNMSYLLYKKDNSSLTGEVGFRHDRYKWNAYDAYGVYSQYNDDYDLIGFRNGDMVSSGKAISYDQEFYTPYLGLTFNTKKDKWVISSYVRGSLWAWGEAEDNHYSPAYTINEVYDIPAGEKNTYKDEFDNISYISLGLNIGYILTEDITITLSGDFQRYIREKGSSKIKVYNYDESEYNYYESGDGAGTSNYSYMISLGATYIF